MVQDSRIDVDPHGGGRAAADHHLSHAPDLGQFLGQNGRGRVVDARFGIGGAGERQDHDRRIGRIDLLPGRIAGQVGRQLAPGGVDRRLHVAGGGVDVAIEIELMAIDVCPSVLADDISVIPAIRPNCRSSGVATAEAIVSALAPGNEAETEMLGKSICGSGATGSSTYPSAPARVMATVNSVVPTGRWMNGLERLMSPPPSAIRAAARRPDACPSVWPAARRPGRSPASCRA